MKETNLRAVQKLGEPNPFTLVVSADAEGRPNIMAVSWWTYASYNPLSLLIYLGSKSYTRGLIGHSGEFTLCLVDKVLRKAAFRCGASSVRTVNKAKGFISRWNLPRLSCRPMYGTVRWHWNAASSAGPIPATIRRSSARS
jgi:flavin reductase (DIM6/NTAB) family NADH-FMN oxidoreductase RutF